MTQKKFYVTFDEALTAISKTTIAKNLPEEYGDLNIIVLQVRAASEDKNRVDYNDFLNAVAKRFSFVSKMGGKYIAYHKVVDQLKTQLRHLKKEYI